MGERENRERDFNVFARSLTTVQQGHFCMFSPVKREAVIYK